MARQPEEPELVPDCEPGASPEEVARWAMQVAASSIVAFIEKTGASTGSLLSSELHRVIIQLQTDAPACFA